MNFWVTIPILCLVTGFTALSFTLRQLKKLKCSLDIVDKPARTSFRSVSQHINPFLSIFTRRLNVRDLPVLGHVYLLTIYLQLLWTLSMIALSSFDILIIFLIAVSSTVLSILITLVFCLSYKTATYRDSKLFEPFVIFTTLLLGGLVFCSLSGPAGLQGLYGFFIGLSVDFPIRSAISISYLAWKRHPKTQVDKISPKASPKRSPLKDNTMLRHSPIRNNDMFIRVHFDPEHTIGTHREESEDEAVLVNDHFYCTPRVVCQFSNLSPSPVKYLSPLRVNEPPKDKEKEDFKVDENCIPQFPLFEIVQNNIPQVEDDCFTVVSNDPNEIRNSPNLLGQTIHDENPCGKNDLTDKTEGKTDNVTNQKHDRDIEKQTVQENITNYREKCAEEKIQTCKNSGETDYTNQQKQVENDINKKPEHEKYEKKQNVHKHIDRNVQKNDIKTTNEPVKQSKGKDQSIHMGEQENRFKTPAGEIKTEQKQEILKNHEALTINPHSQRDNAPNEQKYKPTNPRSNQLQIHEEKTTGRIDPTANKQELHKSSPGKTKSIDQDFIQFEKIDCPEPKTLNEGLDSLIEELGQINSTYKEETPIKESTNAQPKDETYTFMEVVPVSKQTQENSTQNDQESASKIFQSVIAHSKVPDLPEKNPNNAIEITSHRIRKPGNPKKISEKRVHKIVPDQGALRLQSPEERNSRGAQSVLSTRSHKQQSQVTPENNSQKFVNLRTRRKTQDPVNDKTEDRKLKNSFNKSKKSKSPGYIPYNQDITSQFDKRSPFQNQENLRLNDKDFIKNQTRKLSSISAVYGILKTKK